MALSDANKARLDNYWKYCVKHQFTNLAYPESADFDYTEISKFMAFSLNNCGNWEEYSNYPLNSFVFERDVIEYFTRLYGSTLEESWGYVTSGGTEGNLYGCMLARESFPGSTLYYSTASHYSIRKICRILNITAREIAARDDGEMDYAALAQAVSQDGESHPIIFANIGTTMHGAVDNIHDIQYALAAINIMPGRYYIHCDAALSGMILPFIDTAPAYTLADGANSIAVSGHKMLGSPIPCGVVIAKRNSSEKVAQRVDYIDANDNTISGSRDGISPLILWYGLNAHTEQQRRTRIRHCLDMAQNAVDKMRRNNIPAWRHPHSITIVFPTPHQELCRKYQLAVSNNIAHIVITAHHLDHPAIDNFIDELVMYEKADRRLVNASNQTLK